MSIEAGRGKPCGPADILFCIPEEITVLSLGQDQHISYNVDNTSINTEFELFYQNLLHDNYHLPKHTLSRIKTKLRYTCEKDCDF